MSQIGHLGPVGLGLLDIGLDRVGSRNLDPITSLIATELPKIWSRCLGGVV